MVFGNKIDGTYQRHPLQDKIVFVMKDTAWVEQALVMGATLRTF